MGYSQYTIEEMKNMRKNGYNVVSLFAGGGGSSMGYLSSGYNVKAAVEFEKNAIAAYQANFDAPVIGRDIREVKGEDILKLIGLKKYELDILDGSPPCDSFSIAGVREKYWGKEKHYSGVIQRTDDLFFEYLRLVKEMMPKVFVAENVKGLIRGSANEYVKQIMAKAESIGYDTEIKLLNASDYGVPQARERVIFIGVRKDLKLKPVYPAPFSEKVTTKDAIADLIDAPVDHTPLTPERLELVRALGPEVSSKQIGEYEKIHGKKIYRMYYIRDYWNKPCYTILATERYLHPLCERVLSTNEAKRLQSFPDDYKMTESPNQNWRRIGMSVPPKLMEAISKTVQTEILDKVKDYKIEDAEKFFSSWEDNYSVKILGDEIDI